MLLYFFRHDEGFFYDYVACTYRIMVFIFTTNCSHIQPKRRNTAQSRASSWYNKGLIKPTLTCTPARTYNMVELTLKLSGESYWPCVKQQRRAVGKWRKCLRTSCNIYKVSFFISPMVKPTFFVGWKQSIIEVNFPIRQQPMTKRHGFNSIVAIYWLKVKTESVLSTFRRKVSSH